ncbi:hypothetical protein [Nocardia inohanensis]|uniref:hypothetical protein n=1 Tax=Nocardia inohanensis TaxID=209246 RepID=UPI00082E076E|nr:hypothetical protein [Nocardia inohanensis]
MKARAFAGAALAAVAMVVAGTGTASAEPIDVDPALFMDGDTVYFADWYNAAYCAIHANGDVGCDIPAGGTLWGVIPVNDVVIDMAFLPAHPTFGLAGPHGRPGSRWITDVPRPDGNVYDGTRITYAGVTCVGGRAGRGGGGITCDAKGHHFRTAPLSIS